MKKLVTLLLALALCLSLMPAMADDPITIEIMYSPWGSITAPDVDPYEEYLEAKYGCNIVLSPTSDFNNQLLTRFASDDNQPDIVLLSNSTLTMLYDQGVLLEDWTPYVDKLPDAMACLSEDCLKYFTRDGKLVCMPTNENVNNIYAFMIRKDWLKALEMDMPSNLDELLDYMRACTFNDPDGNGENDTWGLGAIYQNGNGILGKMQLLFGNNDFYVTEEGTVSHPILDGSFLKYLEYCYTCISEGLIDPDWYTKGNQDYKISSYGGKYGMTPKQVYHTIIETDNARGNDGYTTEMWEVMDLFQGKLKYGNLYSYARTVSKKASEDAAKMDIICKIFNDCAYPNDDLFTVCFGVGIDEMDVKLDVGTTTTFLGYSTPEKKNARLKIDGSFYWGYQQAFYSAPNGWEFIYMTGAEPDATLNYFLEQSAKAAAQPRYGNESALLNLDATLLEEANNFKKEYEVNFFLGYNTADNYEEFVQSWLDLGGQDLLDEAEATFREFGLID